MVGGVCGYYTLLDWAETWLKWSLVLTKCLAIKGSLCPSTARRQLAYIWGQLGYDLLVIYSAFSSTECFAQQ